MKAKFKLIHNRKNKLNNEGQAPVVVEIYLNRKRKYVSTGIIIEPKFWDDKAKIVNRKHPDSQQLNDIIYSIIERLKSIEHQAFLEKGTFELSDIDTSEPESKSFIDFSLERIEGRQVAKYTRTKERRAINYFKDFSGGVMFEDLTYKLISDFDTYLFQVKKLHINTVHATHKVIKFYINIAIKEDIITPDKNPYLKFKLKKIPGTRETLTEQEIEKIEKLVFSDNTDNIKIVRDMFLFSCYTGLRFSDLQQIRGSDFTEEKQTVYLSITQSKTDRRVDIPLHALFNGKALPIYRAYVRERLSEPIFPEYSNQHANRILKVIALTTGIESSLTFHIGRHTFGTMIAKHTGDQFLIRSLMGHSNIQTSQIYIHLSKRHIEDKLKGINW